MPNNSLEDIYLLTKLYLPINSPGGIFVTISVNTQFSGLGNAQILEERDTGSDRDFPEKFPEVCQYGTPDVRLDTRIVTVVSECFSEVGNPRKTQKTEKSRADSGCLGSMGAAGTPPPLSSPFCRRCRQVLTFR